MAQSIVVAMALAGWLMLTVENGAEQPAVSGEAFASPRPRSTTLRVSQVDTGWTVALPSAIATGTTDPQQQIVFQQVLEQGRTPIISRGQGTWRTEQGAGNEEHESEHAEREEIAADEADASDTRPPVRFAVRPDGIEGWRSPGPVFAPREGPWQPPMIGTRPETPNARFADRDSIGDSSSENGDARSDAEATVSRDTEQKSFAELLGDVSTGPLAGGTPDQRTDGAEADETTADGAVPNLSSPSAEPPPPLSPQLVQLRSRVRSVLKGYFRKPLNSAQHDPWEVMHGMLSYGIHSRIRQGSPRGEPITAIGWLCYNKPCKGQMLLHVNQRGELRAKYGVGLQGHLGQFLAMLAQCRVSPDYPIRVGKHEFTIHDLIEAEMKTCYPKSELTFKLIALQYYLDLNERWVNDQGQDWDIPRLIREELAQPIRGAACGGTHRLSGLSLTVKTRLRRGEPLDGEYARAAAFVEKYHQYAFRLQNRDGSLSTLWFRGRGDEPDINRRIKTTGHILEWLCYSLSDEELRDERTVRAVSYLTNLMSSKYNHEWEVGPMCHAIHALLLYDERVFQPFDNESYDVAYRPRREAATVTYPGTIRR